MKKIYKSIVVFTLLLIPSINLEAKDITTFNIDNVIEDIGILENQKVNQEINISTVDSNICYKGQGESYVAFHCDDMDKWDKWTDTPVPQDSESSDGTTQIYPDGVTADEIIADLELTPESPASNDVNSSTTSNTTEPSTDTYEPSASTDTYASSPADIEYSTDYTQDYELSDEEMAEVYDQSQQEIEQKEREKKHQEEVEAQQEEDKNRREYAFFLNDITHKIRSSSTLITPEYNTVFIFLWLIVITIIYWTGCMTFYFRTKEKFKKEEDVFDFEKEYALQNGVIEDEKYIEEEKNIYSYFDNQYINKFITMVEKVRKNFRYK